ncbi:hypothetical protein LPICM02_180078 [Pseudolactococcus piscium]|nr:hypothetical protein LPICM02_180078 [Lactococcus piscium]
MKPLDAPDPQINNTFFIFFHTFLFDTLIIKQAHDDKQTSFFPITRKLHDFDAKKVPRET